jgi:hypothetical protein
VRREIIINAARTSVPRVALLEDGRLVEMLLEQDKEVCEQARFGVHHMLNSVKVSAF